MIRVLDVLWWLSVFTVGVLSLLLLWSLAGQISLPLRIEAGLRGFGIESGSSLTLVLPVALEAPSSELTNVRADFRFPGQAGAFVPVSLAIIVGLMVQVTWILDQLRKLFGTVKSGDPFVPENARRIGFIGVAIIVFEVLRAFAIAYWSRTAYDLLKASGSPFVLGTHVEMPGILYGLLFMALAAVFREGTRLRNEQSLTI